MKTFRLEAGILLCAAAVVAALGGCVASEDVSLSDGTRASQFVDALVAGNNERLLALGSVDPDETTRANESIERALAGPVVSTDTSVERETETRTTLDVVLKSATGRTATVTVTIVKGTGKVDSVAVSPSAP